VSQGGTAMTFRDRDDAGRRLAARLKDEKFDDPVILALPRGGVPVASHVAATLGAPLDRAERRRRDILTGGDQAAWRGPA
jgi:hypoxanthine phosphoribosyltransferase